VTSGADEGAGPSGEPPGERTREHGEQPGGRAREGLDHLQAAGLELIAAARAFLDVAEALVREPGTASAAVQAVEGLVREARSGGQAPDGAEPAPPAEDGAVRSIRLS
jgi:hypothetical protein